MGKYKNTNLLKIKHVLKENFNNVSEIDLKVKELEENFKIKNKEESNKDILVYKSIEKDEIEFKKEYSLKEGIKILEKAKVKFNKSDVLFVVRDESNQLIWLENGNLKAGLKHIKFRHKSDFKNKFNVEEDDIPNFIKDIIKNSKILLCIKEYRNGILCLTKYYLYKDKYYVLGAIGTNGFISNIYPIRKEDCEKKLKMYGGNENE